MFKVSSSTAFNMSDAACRRLLAAVRNTRRIDLHVAMPDNRTLELQATSNNLELRRRYPVESFPARERPLDIEILKTVFAKGGRQSIDLAELTAAKLPPIVIPPSRLKEIRRDFFEQLQRQLADAGAKSSGRQKQQALSALLPKTDSPPPPGSQSLTVAVRSLSEARLIENREVDRLLVPLEAGVENRLGKLPQRLKKNRDRLVWDIPFIIFDRDWPAFNATIGALIDAGWTSFRLNNLAHFAFFPEQQANLISGYRLFTLNTQAALAWQGLGVGEATLYIEDDRQNMLELLGRDCGLTFNVVAYSQVPMMTTRVPMPRVRTGSPLVSGRDEHYLVRRRQEIATIAAATDFSLLGNLHQLGGGDRAVFTLDLSHLSAFSPEGKALLGAFTADRPVPATSLFNFDYGME